MAYMHIDTSVCVRVFALMLMIYTQPFPYSARQRSSFFLCLSKSPPSERQQPAVTFCVHTRMHAQLLQV